MTKFRPSLAGGGEGVGSGALDQVEAEIASASSEGAVGAGWRSWGRWLVIPTVGEPLEVGLDARVTGRDLGLVALDQLDRLLQREQVRLAPSAGSWKLAPRG
jgi:hypothetical protein